MRDDSPTADLVLRARKGDSDAWDALVERFAPLIWSICRRYSLGRTDAEDIGQYVWLRLVDQLDAVHDPAALPGWLATTTQRECIRALRAARNQHASWYEPDVESIPDEQTAMAEHEVLLAERHAALREAFTRLPPPCQRLIALLLEDPPMPYAEISARLGIPVGSIGPSRGAASPRSGRPGAEATCERHPGSYPFTVTATDSSQFPQYRLTAIRPHGRSIRRGDA
jgi:RNA polymerase sigma factor (sigma-70 family)